VRRRLLIAVGPTAGHVYTALPIGGTDGDQQAPSHANPRAACDGAC